MKFQPSRNYVSNDVVMTPTHLAKAVVEHFKPSGTILELCCGDGSFLNLMPGAEWCEITKGRDFLLHTETIHYDWIVTNPPWSKIREFLRKSFLLADNIVFLMTVNHVFTKARMKMMFDSGFGLREILLFDMPKEFPQSGFQLGAIHYKRGWQDECAITRV